jgi:hypothetical protein
MHHLPTIAAEVAKRELQMASSSPESQFEAPYKRHPETNPTHVSLGRVE